MTPDQPPRWDNAPSWGSPSDAQFRPAPPGGYGMPPQRSGLSAPVIVFLVLGSVLLLGILVAGAIVLAPRFSGTVAAPATWTVSATATAPAEAANPPTVQPARPAQGSRPAGAYECMDRGAGPYSAAAVGSSATSCEFAEVVWSQYVGSGGTGQAMTVNAYSPVTGQSYAMSCAGGPVVTCTGGNNAVVHLY